MKRTLCAFLSVIMLALSVVTVFAVEVKKAENIENIYTLDTETPSQEYDYTILENGTAKIKNTKVTILMLVSQVRLMVVLSQA